MKIFKVGVLLIVAIFALLSCKKNIVEHSLNPNIKINGWKIDSIRFDYNWISPTDIDYLSLKTGYILGSNGYLIKTTDFAKSWVQTYIEKDSSGVMTKSISFINDSTGFIYGTYNVLNGAFYGVLYKTTDSGNHWIKKYYSTAYNFQSMKFFDASHGIALNYTNNGSYIFTTENGGLSWEQSNVHLASYAFRLFFLGDTCYADGANSDILKSTDKGKTWVSISTPQTVNGFVQGYYFLNENTGFVCLPNTRYKTTNGGNNWVKIDIPFGFRTPWKPFENFHFCNASEGIAIADSMAYIGGDFPSLIGSYAYTTTDGGNTWDKSELMRNFYFGAIIFVTENFAYCISNKHIYTLQKE
jgi:photosystem II stability/assembly factor-like uncharacterized protein